MRRSESGAGLWSPNGEWAFNTGSERDAAAAVTIDDAAIAEWLGRPVGPAVADLIELVAAVQLVDRMERRPPALHGGDSWARELCVVVGVRDPEMWRADGVSQQLRELMVWLTDDDWAIEFAARDAPVRPGESFQFLFRNPAEGSVVSLYSGGLDSFAGLALDLDEHTVPVLVSVVSNSRQGASQAHTVDSLQERLGVAVPRVAVKSHLRRMEPRESSHRTRGLGFLAVAASVAAMSDIDTVHVYENGIGAINLPYSRAQGGAQSTRSMHPETLRRAAALFSVVLDQPIVFINTNQYRTKGEMCRRMPAGLRSIVPRVMSCDMAFAHRATKVPSCGICTSCLLRRQALWSAGLGAIDQQTSYRTDVLNDKMTDLGESRHLKSMLSQAARIEMALSDNNPWHSLLTEFPELVDAVDALTSVGPAATVEERIVGMFRRYANEWRSFPVGIAGAYLPSPAKHGA